MSIRNEIITVAIGQDFLYPTTVSISSGVGKGYNTCTIVGINLQCNVGDIITITINGDVYSFIIDMKDYGKQDKVTLKCKGIPSILEDLSPTNTDYIYSNSDELIEDSRGSVEVENNIPTISFQSQSYSAVSTPMSRILDMVDVVGGEAYEVNGTLHLEEQKVIGESPIAVHTFSDNEVFDFSYSSNRDQSSRVKEILFNPITEDIFGIPSVTLDYDEKFFRGEVYFNPSLTAGYSYEIYGLGQREAVRSVKTEVIDVDDDNFINTIGGIDAIVDISINGIPYSNYFLYAGWNVVRFNAPQTGTVSVTYYTKSVSVFIYRTTNFEIKYQCNVCKGTIEIDAGNTTSNGNCYTEIVEPHTYEYGGTVLISIGADCTLLFVEYKGATNLVNETTVSLTGGGTASIQYLYGAVDWTSGQKSFMNNITSAVKSTIETTNKEILYDEDLDEYVVFLDKPITSINDIYFGSSVINGYVYDNSGVVPRILFDAIDVGKEVDISMTIDLIEITIPAPTEGNPVRLLDVISCGGVATTEYILADNVLCNLPATFDVDIASSFDVPIEDCFGKEVLGDFGSLIVNNFGMVNITVTEQGTFTLDCHKIKENGIITINSIGVV